MSNEHARKSAIENELHQEVERASRYRAILDHSVGFLSILSPEGVMLDCNQAPLDVGGLSREDVLGKPFWKTPWFEGLARSQRRGREMIEEVVATGERQRDEFEYRSADGVRRWTDRTVTPVKDAQGELNFLLVEARDITEPKMASEAELRESEEARLQSESLAEAVMTSVTSGVIVYDRQLRYVAWNKSMERATGLTADEVQGKRAVDVFPHLVEEGVDTLLERALDGETVVSKDRVFHRRDDDADPVWVQGVYTPHFKGGEIVGVVGVVHDVTERKRAEENAVRLRAEAAAREEAEAMARLKSSLLANMSHEIRTPLTTILLQTQLLESQLGDDQRDQLGRILRAGDRLTDTLRSVLTLAELESGGLEPSLSKVDVVAEIAGCIEAFEFLAKKQGLELRFVCESAEIEAICDGSFLLRILNGLIGNAIKFTQDGHVEVSLEADADELIIAVHDTGIGIDADFRDDLFEAFKQESSGWTRAYEGTGLGLSITLRLVRALGGHIEIDSEKGRGSVFTVRLPRWPETTAPER